MTIKILPNDKGTPELKLADVELHFDAGDLCGMKLVGFSIYRNRSSHELRVTMPARQYSVNGERRAFALLRPTHTQDGVNFLVKQILDAYVEFDAHGVTP